MIDNTWLRDQRRWRWLALLVLAGGLIWLLSPILTPFVLSALLAWLGNPLVLRLEKAGRSRNTAVIIVFVLMSLILALILILLIPLLEEQIRELILWLPRLDPRSPRPMPRVPPRYARLFSTPVFKLVVTRIKNTSDHTRITKLF